MRGLVNYAKEIQKYVPSPIFKAGAQAFIDKEFPRHLFIETTSICNLDCCYCTRPKGGQHMDYRLFQAIIDEASRYGPRSFSLHMFGEPTMWPYLGRAIKLIKRYNRKHKILLTTNGVRLGSPREYKQVDEILWTWRKEAPISPEVAEAFEREGISFRVRFFENVPEKELDRWVSWKNKDVRTFHNFAGTLHERIREPKRWACYHLWLAPAVSAKGNILICCADPHQRVRLGKFPDTSIYEAWQSEKLKQIRQDHLSGVFEGPCENCNVWATYKDIFFKWQKHS